MGSSLRVHMSAISSEFHANQAPPIRVIFHEYPTFGQFYRRDGLGYAVLRYTGQLVACRRCRQIMRVDRRRVPALFVNDDEEIQFVVWVEQPNVVRSSEVPPRYWLQHITCSTNLELQIFPESEDSDSDFEAAP